MEKRNSLDVMFNIIDGQSNNVMNDIFSICEKHQLTNQEKDSMRQAFYEVENVGFCNADLYRCMSWQLRQLALHIERMVSGYMTFKFGDRGDSLWSWTDEEVKGAMGEDFADVYNAAYLNDYHTTINDNAQMCFDEHVKFLESYNRLALGAMQIDKFLVKERESIGKRIAQLTNEIKADYADIFGYKLDLKAMRAEHPTRINVYGATNGMLIVKSNENPKFIHISHYHSTDIHTLDLIRRTLECMLADERAHAKVRVTIEIERRELERIKDQIKIIEG